MLGNTILRTNDLIAYTGLSRSTINRFVRDGLLPKPRKMGTKINYWVREEIDQALHILEVHGKPVMSVGAKSEVKSEVKPEVKPETKSEIKPTSKSTAKVNAKSESTPSPAPKIKIKGRFKPGVNKVA